MYDLLGLLLPATWVTWTLGVHEYRSRQNPASLRLSACIALILLCGAVTASTEILSLMRAVTFWPILAFWIAANLAAIPFLRGTRASITPRLRRLRPQNHAEWVLASMTVAILLLMFVCGRLFPPRTYDTLTYHLPRQVMWWQQGSVEHFDSGKLRNLIMPPLTEFIGLHLMVLTKNDFWHTGVQWVFTLVGIGAASRLVRQAGGSRNAQWIAALFIVTFPAAYLEASSAKNDLALGAFLLIFITLAMLPKQSVGTLCNCALLGLTLGLAIFTKGTAYIFMLPVVAWCFWRIIQTKRARSLGGIAVIVLLVAAINAGHIIRNYRTFGNALDRSRGEADAIMVNESHTPARMISVLSRNLASLSLTPVDTLNAISFDGLKMLHAMLNLSLDDPATSYVPFELKGAYFFHEECAASLLHNILAMGGALMVLVMFRRHHPLMIGMALCMIAGFVVFSLYLKWQPWHVRLLLPLLFLAGPIAATVIDQKKKNNNSEYVTASVLLVLSLSPFLFSGPRPLLAAGPWMVKREAMRDLRDSQNIIEGGQIFGKMIDDHPEIRRVGFANYTFDECDYIMMKALLDHTQRMPAYCYVNPLVKVQGYPDGPIDAIVATKNNLFVTDKTSGKRYAAMMHVPPYSFYLPAQIPSLTDVPLIVQGIISEVTALNDDGLGAATLNVESVLLGPADTRQVRIVTCTNRYYLNHLASSVQSKTGYRGIWLLKPTPINGLYMLESAQYLLPDSELPEIRKLIPQ